jgi:ABC-type enterobactin transport system permease subunit
MSMTLAQFAQPFDFDRLQQIVVVNGAIGRLLMACLLGARLACSGRSSARPPACAPTC